VLAGVKLSVRHLETGMNRTTTTSADGRYLINAASPGEYEIRAEAPGFRAYVRKGLRVTVGETAVVDFAMEVGPVDQAITVDARANAVNTNSGELSYLVAEDAIRELPLNGRNYTDLSLLQPGVVSYPHRDGGSVVAHGLGISVNGQDPRSNVFLLDGTPQNDFTNGPAGSAAGTVLGTETIREFRVETNAYNAEFGRNSGGQINVVSKSGSNDLHGSLYEFHRNDNLDARNFFDSAGKPEFKRNQFGGAVGGPIKRDRTFFFLGYESLRDRLGKTISTIVPDAQARLGIFGGAAPIPISPQVRPYLEQYPLANGGNLGGGLAVYNFLFNQQINQHFAQGRVDHQINSRNQVFARYTFDDADQVLPTDYPQFPRDFLSRNQFATVELRQVITPSTMNVARAGFSRTRIGQIVQANVPAELRPFIPGQSTMGDIDVGGLLRFGPQSSGNLRLTQNVTGFEDGLSLVRGRHELKFGGLLEHYQDNMYNPTFGAGIYTFAGLPAFLQNQPVRFIGISPQGALDRYWRFNLVAFYAQDNWRASSRLTLNLGLRYEFSTMPVDIYGRDSALINGTDRAPTVGKLYNNPTYKNFSPRFGFAWNPMGTGRTSVRGGYGLYFNTNNQQNLIVTVTNPPATPRFVIPNPTFPAPPFERGVGNTIRPMQWDLQSPRLHVWNVSVQRALPADIIVTAGYAGSRGMHLYRNSDVNIPAPAAGPGGRPFFAAGLPRPNTAFGTIELKSSDGDSWYRALILEARRAWRNGLSVQSSYTWSHSEDTTQASTFFSDATNGTTVAFPEFIPGYNKGPSDWNTPHNWVVNVVWDVPFARSLTGAARALLDGWQVSGIGTMRSGQPLTVFVQNNWSRSQWSPSIAPNTGLDRPDLAAGRTPASAVLGRPDQWFDPSAFVLQPQGTLGNSPRGAFRGPDLRTVDVAAVKRVPLRGSVRADLRVEVFNLFNRANFGNPTLIAFAGATAGEAPLASFGRIRSTVTSSRQMQIGVRVVF